MEIGSCPKNRRDQPCSLCRRPISDPKFCTLIRDDTKDVLAENEVLEVYCSACTLQVFEIFLFQANWDDEEPEKKHYTN